ncbi:MAG: DUF721 domain-containing protein [Sulfuricellaceae bacterium]|nr:DUF721 domain-containing protein [Sulfuricellaceae bacterium]
MPTQKLRHYFDFSPKLHTWIQQADYLRSLQQVLLSELPAALQPSCRVGSFASDGILTIYAANGAVASKLRLQAPSLLAKLKILRAEVTAIRIEVQVSPPQKPPQGPKRARLGEAGVAEFKTLADQLEESPLKRVLLRLVRHGEAALHPAIGPQPDGEDTQKSKR